MPRRKEGNTRSNGPLVLGRAISAPVVNQMASKPAPTGGLRYTMSEVLGTVTTSGLKTHQMSPVFFNGSWTRTLCLAFERYKFHRLVVKFVPVVGTDVNGSVSAGFDLDPYDENKYTTAGIVAGANGITSPVWKPFELSLKNEARDWFYVSTTYTSEWSRDNIFGLLQYKLSYHDPSTTTKTFMQVFVDYDIELRNPTFSIRQMANALAKQIEGGPITATQTAAIPWFNGTKLGDLPVRNPSYGDVFFDQPGEYSVEYSFIGDHDFEPVVDAARTNVTWKQQGHTHHSQFNNNQEAWIRLLVRVLEPGLKLALARVANSAWQRSRLIVNPYPYH